QQTVSFWRSDSTLFDVPQDLMVLDACLADLELQLPGQASLTGSQRSNLRLDLRTLVELELGRSSVEASYALFRLPRSVFAGSFNAATGIVETAPASQSEAIALARQGAGSALDAFLLEHQQEWQLLGNGAFNQTPLNFRHDPDYVYFLGFDDALLSVRDNARSEILKAEFNLDELTGPNPSGPIVYDRPLHAANDSSTSLLAAGRRFLAELFQLSTGVNAQGKPISGVIASDSLEAWLAEFSKTLTGPVQLIDNSTANKIDASLVRSKTSDFDLTFGFDYSSLPILSFDPSLFYSPSLAVNSDLFLDSKLASSVSTASLSGSALTPATTASVINTTISIDGISSGLYTSYGSAPSGLSGGLSLNAPLSALVPALELQLNLAQATVEQRLLQLLASNIETKLAIESFAGSLPAASSSTTISQTSRDITSTVAVQAWDVEAKTTARLELSPYAELNKTQSSFTALAQSFNDVAISSRGLSLGAGRVAAFADHPRTELIGDADGQPLSSVYAAYWLPVSDGRGGFNFNWANEFEGQFNDLSTTSTTVDPLASMVSISLPKAEDVHSVKLEVNYVSDWLNGIDGAQRGPGGHNFRVNQYKKLTLSGKDSYELVDSRIAWLEANATYVDPYGGDVDVISFTPYYTSGSFYSVPLLNGLSAVGLQLSIDDIATSETTSTTQTYTLNHETRLFSDSDLKIAAYRGQQFNGDKLGQASLEISNGALEISATQLPVLPLPLLSLSKGSGEAFTLQTISFAATSSGSFNAILTGYDGSTSTVPLLFNGSASSAAEASQLLLAQLNAPIQRIDFRAVGASSTISSLLSHRLGIQELQLASALGTAPVNLSRDLSSARIESMGAIPSAARLHLDTAVLKGLSADRVALEQLTLLLQKTSLAYLSADQGGMLDLSGRSIAELIAIGRTGLLDGKPVNAPAFDVASLASLLQSPLILRPTTIGLTDDIHALEQAVQVLLRPVESPLEVLRNTAALEPETRATRLELAEGSLFPDATLAAFGDVDLGGPLSDLYLGGMRAGMIADDPVFALPATPEASRSTIPALAMVTLHDTIHLLSEADLGRATLADTAPGRRHPLLPGPIGVAGLDQGNAIVHRDFSLAELIGTPIPGRTYQIQALAAFSARFAGADSATPLALRLQILSADNQLIDRLQDDDNRLATGNRSDADGLTLIWSEKLAGARLRVAPAINFASTTSLATAQTLLGDSAFRLQVGILDTPALEEGSASWADIDNDGDVDLLLSGLDASTGLLTTQLLRNPLVGGGSGFERLSIALPGLQRAVASWGDLDLDGDLDLAVSGVQGTAERPYLQVFRNTTSQRLSAPGPGEPPFAGSLNRRPDRPDAISTTWNGDQGAVQLGWSFSHLRNDDAPYTYNLAIGRAPRTGTDRIAPGQGRVFDQIAPLADPISGERRIAAAGNQGFHNLGLFSAGLPGETYHWSVQAIDKGFRGSLWADGEDFTIQPLQPQLLSDTNPVLNSRSLIGAIPVGPAGAAVSIDLDSDGLRDRVRYDAIARRLLVEQGSGSDGSALRPFLGPTGGLIAHLPTFLASLPAGASETSLQVVDRSFLADSAEGQWTLTVDLDGSSGMAPAAIVASFRSGDPLGDALDLAGDLLSRQRYRLASVPTDVQLFLHGEDVRAPLMGGHNANLSFTLEDARSGALRFLFRDPAAATAGDITLALVPLTGNGPATYSLRLQDLGDGRPDLLVSWVDAEMDGTPPAQFAVLANRAVRGNQEPIAPELIALELGDSAGSTGLRVHWQPGRDAESPTTQLRHQWRVAGADAASPGPWQDNPAPAADGSLWLSATALGAAGLADALSPGTSLRLELRVLDAGDREALSGASLLSLPALPAPDTRPALIGLAAVELLEGDNLQHRGSDLIPLQLRQRLLAVEPGDAGAVAASQIRLVLPDGFSGAGSFRLRQSDGSTTAAPLALPLLDSPGLLAM
ncbi:MAG: hypothetical protein RLZZ124_236, partial [Cyanobacteriota bacterium]